MGARLRLRRDWYEANRDQFSGPNRVILKALYTFGGMVADLASFGLWISGANDHRWEAKDQLALRSIPATAFEMLDTIHSKVSFTGPTSGAVGVRNTFTISHVVPGDSNFAPNVYFLQSSDGGKTWKSEGWKPNGLEIDDIHRGPFTVSFVPLVPGTYLLKAKPYLDWVEPSMISFTTTSASL